ncbi:HAD hydrolase, subfamily IA [Parasponia andersonii]|uniref:HAD hydrolase, subfamily IA n=1 Tax=Parasponia andersonii TaxID=3476 RepID=A0A2P5B9M6_PARAD|nr:HAD hydrolase, subfamily IA [Parasponia andersonii]
MALLLRLPTICPPSRPSLHLHSTTRNTMALNSPKHYTSITTTTDNRKLPILLFDIMDTIVLDPFYHHVPPFFGMSMKELLECKHPNAWLEFEKGTIDEVELARKFFKDGRPFDLEGLKNCMKRGYSYIDGVEELLYVLKTNNYEMHAFTNYPTWCEMIEDKLKISRYMSWTFCSFKTGKRKPDPDFYLDALKHLKVDPANCIFVDDRMKNVEAAIAVGIVGLHFKNAETLRRDLSLMGIDVSG